MKESSDMRGWGTRSILSLGLKIFCLLLQREIRGSSGLCFKKIAFGHTSVSLKLNFLIRYSQWTFLFLFFVKWTLFLTEYGLFIRYSKKFHLLNVRISCIPYTSLQFRVLTAHANMTVFVHTSFKIAIGWNQRILYLSGRYLKWDWPRNDYRLSHGQSFWLSVNGKSTGTE